MTPKILVVDDQPYMHALMRHNLQRAGCEMIAASNGHEAIEASLRHSPHVIVMDVMMEGMDGLTALKHLKADEATRNIPVIMITANAHQMTRDDAEKSGAALFLTKPFSPTKLLQEIQKLVITGPFA